MGGNWVYHSMSLEIYRVSLCYLVSSHARRNQRDNREFERNTHHRLRGLAVVS